jgi:alpha-L-glutamate ligase-like protein
VAGASRGKSSEILGINRRNLEFVYRMNPRERFRRVDDKIRTKEILVGAGLPVPEAIACVSRREEIAPCLALLRARSRFVVKPAKGYGGAGVRSYSTEGAGLGRGGGIEWDEVAFHMVSILSGMFALGSVSDRALVEERAEESPTLQRIHGGDGVSDVRVLVCDSRPVMAMLRLPCAASGPVANLHRGGIGVGVELERGLTTFAVQRGRPISVHPDTGVTLEGVSVPFWEEILRLVAPLNGLFGMGYLGADIVPDPKRGPLILELNARPGLTIQLANRRGLLGVLPRAGSSG